MRVRACVRACLRLGPNERTINMRRLRLGPIIRSEWGPVRRVWGESLASRHHEVTRRIDRRRTRGMSESFLAVSAIRAYDLHAAERRRRLPKPAHLVKAELGIVLKG